MSTPETVHDQIERVEQMAVDSDDMWDLSLNDQAALCTVLSQRSELLAALCEVQSQCACHADEFSQRVWAIAEAAIAKAEGKGQAA